MFLFQNRTYVKSWEYKCVSMRSQQQIYIEKIEIER